MHPMIASIRSTLAAACALAALTVAGCSAQRLVYNQADWLLLMELDSYLDLTEQQEARASASLAAAHLSHRRNQLPALAVAFSDASKRAKSGLTEADVRWFMDQGLALLRDSLSEVVPTVARTLATLSPEQRRYLARRLEERNEDYAERHGLDLPRDERLERRAERTVDRIEDWTGPLSEEQVALVHEIRDTMPDGAADWLAYTRTRQQALLALLDGGATAQAIESELRGWWLFEDPLPPGIERRRQEQVEALVRLVVRLDATLNSMQRAHLIDRLDDLARDARELSREA